MVVVSQIRECKHCLSDIRKIDEKNYAHLLTGMIYCGWPPVDTKAEPND